MAVKWDVIPTGVKRNGELVAELNSEGNLKAVDGFENYISAASKQWKNRKSEVLNTTPPDKADKSIIENNFDQSEKSEKSDKSDKADKADKSDDDADKVETVIPAPPAMDPAKGVKTPAYKAWKEKYNPSPEQLEIFHGKGKKRGR